MTGRELEELVCYTGQERAMRALCLSREMISADKLAVMTLTEVCNRIAERFNFLGRAEGNQRILLVEKDKWDAVWEHIVPIDR